MMEEINRKEKGGGRREGKGVKRMNNEKKGKLKG